MTKDSGKQDGVGRRTVLRRVGALGVAGAVGVGGLQYFGTEPVFALEERTFTADDVSITSGDGSINDVWFKPVPTYSWSALDSSPESITFTLSAESSALDGQYEELGSETKSLSEGGQSGEGEYTFDDKLSLISESASWSKERFEAENDGESEDVGPIGVRIEAELETSTGDTHTDTNDSEFVVDVTNEAVEFGDDGSDSGKGGVGGVAGTGGS
ncbi:hypothetical protein [Halococcus hamelinensis]|uniref:Uncharacterized protein n=1 Tax=Halococcus hamelinensis 100A6 TaxID=1132509 RepID=M0M5U5_9EURY|nr:hypothetical protein [Halococcus hamelinensis]EMA41056.1 hypothetical protein C447_02627 [Halococcus hamelinensis 100A6]